MVYAANGREIAIDNDDLVSTNYNVEVSYEYFLQKVTQTLERAIINLLASHVGLQRSCSIHIGLDISDPSPWRSGCSVHPWMMDGRPQYEALPYVLSQDVQPCFDGDGDDINNINKKSRGR